MIRHTGRGEGVVAMGSCETSSGRGREQMNTNNNECLVLESLFCAAPANYFSWIISLNSHIKVLG